MRPYVLEIHPSCDIYISRSFLFIPFYCMYCGTSNSTVWMYHNLFSHLPIVGHVGWYSPWLLQTKLVRTIMYMFLCEPKFSFYWVQCPTVGLLGHMVSVHLVLKETIKLFSSVCSILYSYQQYMKDLVSLYSHQYQALLLFFILAILTNIQ